jgi:broad specificity phosphatase PhoE
MTTIYLIRHGQAEAGWNIQHDPGLSDTGRLQANEAARALADRGAVTHHRQSTAQDA